jgi:membrane protease YdiL (CAAX protease family)
VNKLKMDQQSNLHELVSPEVAEILSSLYFSLLHLANSRSAETFNLVVAKPTCSGVKFVAVLAEREPALC